MKELKKHSIDGFYVATVEHCPPDGELSNVRNSDGTFADYSTGNWGCSYYTIIRKIDDNIYFDLENLWVVLAEKDPKVSCYVVMQKESLDRYSKGKKKLTIKEMKKICEQFRKNNQDGQVESIKTLKYCFLGRDFCDANKFKSSSNY